MDSLIFFVNKPLKIWSIRLFLLSLQKNKNYINHGTRKEIF